MSGITSIRLRNFRRYEDETVVLQGGLNFLEGENNAGKTSVLYACEYALFGRVGALAPSALMHPKTRTVGVELCFVGRDGQHYRLQRIHVKPPKSKTTVHGHFTLKSRAPDQEAETYIVSSDFDDLETDLAAALQDALGFTRRAWQLAVHHRQGKIADILEGSTQLDMVLGVTSAVFVEEEFRAMALEREKAARDLPALEAKLEQLAEEREGRVSRKAVLGAELEAAQKRAAEVAERLQSLDARRQSVEQLAELVSAQWEAQSETDEATADLRRAEEARDALGEKSALDATVDDSARRETALEGARTTAQQAQRELHDEAKTLAAARGDLEGRLRRRQELEGGGQCDHCGQEVTAEHLAAQIPPLEAELTALNAQIGEVDNRADAAQATLDAAEEAWSAARLAASEARGVAERHGAAQETVDAASGQVQTTRAALEAAKSAVIAAVPDIDPDAIATHLQTERESVTADGARLDADAEHAAELVERISTEVGEVDDAIARCDRDSAEAHTSAEKLKSDAAVAKRLRVLGKGFKSVQRDLREGASAQMGERAFAIHKHLSGDDRELKALDIDPKKYAVLVTPKDVGSKVPAALYQGGGHRLLLGLAVKLALAEQIGPFPFVLLDEPTYGLDGARKLALLERISELEVAGQLILITHADLGDAKGHRQRVVRDGNHSRIVGGAP